MKRIITMGLIFLLVFAFSGCTSKQKESSEEPKQTTNAMVAGSFVGFDYSALKEEAVAILKVKALDNLTVENSYVTFYEYEGVPQNQVKSFYGNRKVKVLEVYKGNLLTGEEITITETAAMVAYNDDEYLFAPGGVVPLVQGNEYVVFLAYAENAQEEQVLHLIAGSNGTIELTNFSSNLRPDIAVRTAVDYFIDLPNQVKEEILYSEDIYLEQVPVSLDQVKKRVTGQGIMNLEYNGSGDTTYIQVEIDGQRILVEASKEARTQLNALVSE